MCCLLLTPQNAGKNKQAVTREGKQTGEKQKKKWYKKQGKIKNNTEENRLQRNNVRSYN